MLTRRSLALGIARLGGVHKGPTRPSQRRKRKPPPRPEHRGASFSSLRMGFGAGHLPHRRETGQSRRGMGRSRAHMDPKAFGPIGGGNCFASNAAGHVAHLAVRDNTYARLNRTASSAFGYTRFSRVSRRRRGPARVFKGRRSLNREYIRAHRHPRLLLTKGTGRIHRDPGANRVYLHQRACGCDG